jgi:hypothetical protein
MANVLGNTKWLIPKTYLFTYKSHYYNLHMTQLLAPSLALARKLSRLFAALPQVEAVALAGSQVGEMPDATSDIDLYIYTRADIPLAKRQSIVDQSGGASQANLGLTFWGPGDEWFDAASGIEVDIVYFDVLWMENQLNRVIRDHQASLGYSTCFWHTLRHSQVLYDLHGWFQALQDQSQGDYPEALRHNIIALNHPVLRNIIPSYANQLAKAIKRRDLVSINHRLMALLASYFDVIFAVNCVPHPGEKRLVSIALAWCEKLPNEMASDIDAVLQASATADPTFMTLLTRLLDRLDQWLVEEGFDPHMLRPGMIP